MTTDLDEILAIYAGAWSEPDHARRLALLETCWSETGLYMDPNRSTRGRGELAAYIGDVHRQVPGARIETTGRVSHHNARLYFSWRLVTGQGQVATEGVDFGTLADDGRIQEIVGFFGPPPTL